MHDTCRHDQQIYLPQCTNPPGRQKKLNSAVMRSSSRPPAAPAPSRPPAAGPRLLLTAAKVGCSAWSFSDSRKEPVPHMSGGVSGLDLELKALASPRWLFSGLISDCKRNRSAIWPVSRDMQHWRQLRMCRHFEKMEQITAASEIDKLCLLAPGSAVGQDHVYRHRDVSGCDT